MRSDEVIIIYVLLYKEKYMGIFADYNELEDKIQYYKHTGNYNSNMFDIDKVYISLDNAYVVEGEKNEQ